MDNNQNSNNKNQNQKHKRFRKHRPYGKNNRKKHVDDTKLPTQEAASPIPEEATEAPALDLPSENPATASSFVSNPKEEAIADIEETKEESTEQLEVVGIRFRPAGKNYSFAPDGIYYSMGEEVIVETSQGKEFGTVSSPNRVMAVRKEHLPLKKILRPANDKDRERNEENRELERSARKAFHEKVDEHKLDMTLSDVECAFDRSKLIFYFTSDGRVDFREFVKDMASVFKTRIELRQIGVRDEAKQLGGLGICGRPLCCSTFLDDFQQVSIKMAKEQNLSLNPTKISGTCGRLMCCLRYENDVYVEAAKRCPKADCAVSTPQGNGIVIESNILCGKCKVKLDSDPENVVTFQADELKTIPKQKKNPPSEKTNKEKGKSDKESL